MNTTASTIKVKKTRKPKTEPVEEVVVEEEVVADEVEEDLNEEELKAMKVLEEIRKKKQLQRQREEGLNKAVEINKKYAEKARADIKYNEEVIAKLQEENEVYCCRLLTIEDETDPMKITKWFEDNEPDFLECCLELPKPEKKTTTRKSSVSQGGQTLTPDERWANVPDGTVFRAKSKETTRYFIKRNAISVLECESDGTLTDDSRCYGGIQEAGNAFRVVASIPYHISGWEFLQPYNEKLSKAFSLKKWRGDWNEVQAFLDK